MDTISFATAYSRAKTIEDYANVDEINADIDIFIQENFILLQTAEVLERYLRKRSPAVLLGLDRFLESCNVRGSFQLQQTVRSASISSSKSPASPVGTLDRTSTTSSVMRGTTLPARSNAQSFNTNKISSWAKADIVERELEENRITMDKLQRKFESAKFLLQTEEENMRINVERLEENKIEFEDFLAHNTDSKSGRVFHDKLLRFLEQELKTNDQYLRNVKLKTKSLNTEYKRILTQQQQRMELRERLHPIDIEKLLIENQDQLDILELKNKKLEDLKKVVGRKGQTLVSVKTKLNDTVLSLKNLKQDLKQNKTKWNYTEEQVEKNQNQLVIAENINQNIKNLNNLFKSRDIHTYLLVQYKLEELKMEKRTWDRRSKYLKQQIELLEHQVKQTSSTPRSRAQWGSAWSSRSSNKRSTAHTLIFDSKLTPPSLIARAAREKQSII